MKQEEYKKSFKQIHNSSRAKPEKSRRDVNDKNGNGNNGEINEIESGIDDRIVKFE